MLTLGLMEGIFAATAMFLVMFILTTGDVLPLHRIAAPIALVTTGFIAYAVFESGRITRAIEVAGLVTAGALMFWLPALGLYVCWRLGAPREQAPQQAERLTAIQEQAIPDRPTRAA